jgi:glycosyltransferase involved in cell wall biosynthesis
MQRFSEVLFSGLSARGLRVEQIRPESMLGRFGGGKWSGYVDKLLLFPSRLKKRLNRSPRGELLHICDHSNAVYLRSVAGFPHLVTCHDLLAIRSAHGEIPENRTGATGRIYQRMILAGLNRAGRVACVSAATQADLLRITRLTESQTSVVYNGLNYPYRPMERTEAIARASKLLERSFTGCILHVGGNQWYKNRAGVIGIYAELIKQNAAAPNLVLVGKPLPPSLRTRIEDGGLGDRVMEVSGAENEDLRALYSVADAFLFPSLMEGFGWPIVEAQACGCPVVTSQIAPMTEVGGEAALYVDPRDWSRAARTLNSLLMEGPETKLKRIERSLANAARFATASMIDRYLEEYQMIQSQPQRGAL